MEAKTITIDGTTYDVESFSAGVQQSVSIYNAIQGDLAKAQLEAVKSQSALNFIGEKIAEAIRAELAQKTEGLNGAAKPQ